MSTVKGDGEDSDLRDVTSIATWSVSSAKLGNGVLQLLDGDSATCWQSDGSTPHVISATFPHRMFVHEVQILVNHELDESYTPAKVGLRVFSGLDFVVVGDVVELDQPKGWVRIQVSPVGGAFSLQIAIFANHQNGRDTHVRGVKLLGRRHNERELHFSSQEFCSASAIR